MLIDFSLDDKSPLQITPRELVLQQIDILFDTHKDQVLGDLSFGTEYDKYLYKLKMSNSDIQMQVMNDLNTLNLMGYVPSVNVYLLQGTEKDICLIDIHLTSSDDSIEKIYKIR